MRFWRRRRRALVCRDALRLTRTHAVLPAPGPALPRRLRGPGPARLAVEGIAGAARGAVPEVAAAGGSGDSAHPGLTCGKRVDGGYGGERLGVGRPRPCR